MKQEGGTHDPESFEMEANQLANSGAVPSLALTLASLAALLSALTL